MRERVLTTVVQRGASIAVLAAIVAACIIVAGCSNAVTENGSSSGQSVQPSSSTENNTNAVDTDDGVFTKEELSLYNGQNGQPAYVAIDGLVYDVSSLYVNGNHFGCEAGTDISEEFHKEHSSGILERFEVVGTYLE